MSPEITCKNIIIFISMVLLGSFVLCLSIGVSSVLIHIFEILGKDMIDKIDVFLGVK